MEKGVNTEEEEGDKGEQQGTKAGRRNGKMEGSLERGKEGNREERERGKIRVWMSEKIIKHYTTV